MKSTKQFIDELVEKNNSVYRPAGKVTWRLPTGVLTLDKILGGGLPGGCIVQLYGPPEVGKTSLAYHIAAQSVNAGYETLLIPIEKYSEQHAIGCGIDIDSPNYEVVAADFSELVFNICTEAIRNYPTKVIVLDSIAATRSKADIDKKQKISEFDKGFNIGTQARAISDFMSKIQQPIRRKQALFVTVNQISNEIATWGSRTAPKGGFALQYFSDIKLSMWGKKNKTEHYIDTSITVDKGKDWDITPFGTTSFIVRHQTGVDREVDLINFCEKAGIINKSGSWYSYGDIKVQGLPAFSAELKSKPEISQELYELATTNTSVGVAINEEAMLEAEIEKAKKEFGENSIEVRELELQWEITYGQKEQ